MRTILLKLLCATVFGLLVATPLWAVDAGAFRLDRPVMIGGTEVPAGVYLFTVTDRGLVLVLDDSSRKAIAAAVTRRTALELHDLERADTLVHDWALKELSLGRFTYAFSPGKMPATVASHPTTVVTRIAQVR